MSCGDINKVSELKIAESDKYADKLLDEIKQNRTNEGDIFEKDEEGNLFRVCYQKRKWVLKNGEVKTKLYKKLVPVSTVERKKQGRKKQNNKKLLRCAITKLNDFQCEKLLNYVNEKMLTVDDVDSEELDEAFKGDNKVVNLSRKNNNYNSDTSSEEED